MKEYALIGYPLGHSFSERYFADKFAREGLEGICYKAIPLKSIEELPGMLKEHPNLCGFNVTIPYKEKVMFYLDDASEEARAVGAVNCVKITDGSLVGYNTDVYGFRRSLLKLIGDARPPALVLGSGGASKAVGYVLGKLGIEHVIVSRTQGENRIAYGEITPEIMDKYRLIINATPLGMYPSENTAPDIPYQYITAGHYLFDLVYNPPLSKFLGEGRQKGAAVMNGYDMLVDQAEMSWRIWQ